MQVSLAKSNLPWLRIAFSNAPLGTDVGYPLDEGVRSDGRAGTLVYGPYWRLAAGRYVLRCYCEPGGRGEAALHVWHALGVRQIASCSVQPGGVTELSFTLDVEIPNAEFVLLVGADSTWVFRHFELAEQVARVPGTDRALDRSDLGDNAPFRRVLGLGTHCYTAALLQRLGWRRFSGPFDWIFSSPEMVMHCIEDGFETLLDRHQYEPVPIEERPDPHYYRCHHRFYRERFGVQYVFNHHDVWTDEGHAYVRRCVDRFLSFARSEEPVLLLQTGHNEPSRRKGFAAMADCVAQHYPSCILNSIVVAPPGNGVVPELRLLGKSGAHTLIEVQPIGRWDALSFVEPIDEMAVMGLLRLHRLHLA